MLQHGACQQQNKRASDTAQWLEQSQGHFTCLFVCCEKKVRLSEVKSLNLSLVCLRVFASFIGIAGAARTPSVGRRARTRLVVVSLNFRRDASSPKCPTTNWHLGTESTRGMGTHPVRKQGSCDP